MRTSFLWQLTAQKTGARILTVPVLDDGSLDLEVLSSHLKTPASKILSLCHISNTLGTTNPLDQIIREAKENGVKVVVDGAQSQLSHHRIDLKSLTVISLPFPGTKHTDQWNRGSLWKNGTSPRNASLPRRRRHD